MASKSYPCPACPTLIFRSKPDLSGHYSEFHKGGKIPCPQCKVKVSSISNLRAHLQIHESNPIRKFNCSVDQCGQRFYSTAHAKLHFARVHSTEKSFPCPFLCGKSFKTEWDVKQHILSHTQEKPHKCEQCGRSFSQKSTLTNHVKLQHTFPDEKPHECKQCGMTFKGMYHLKSHIQYIHTPRTKTFLCSQCPKKYFSKAELTSHSATHDPQRKLVECYFCSKRLTRRNALEPHLRLHTTEKPFTCPEEGCNYSSAQSSSLHNHVEKVHHKSPKIRKQLCYFCSTTFAENHEIVRHMRVHTLEKPFSCQLCNKSFKEVSNINSHIRRVHTKEKPHKCNECEKCFTSGGELKQHTVTHMEKKRFFCEVCSYSSYRSAVLKQHSKAMHKSTG